MIDFFTWVRQKTPTWQETVAIETRMYTSYFFLPKPIEKMQHYAAAGEVLPHNGGGNNLCYTVGRGGPVSRLLGHVTNTFDCFYVKLFLPSITHSVSWKSTTTWFVFVFHIIPCKFLYHKILQFYVCTSFFQKSNHNIEKIYDRETCRSLCEKKQVWTKLSSQTYLLKKWRLKISQKGRQNVE